MDIRTPIPSNGGDWLTRFGETWRTQLNELTKQFPKAIEAVQFPGEAPTDVPIVYVKKEHLLTVVKFMQENAAFAYDFLSDLTATDELDEVERRHRSNRFDVVYNLFSTQHHYRFRIKVQVAENDSVPSLVSLWPGANWAEREVWDMFGIRFNGHPDLRRLLMDERYVGHPLRKDFPLRNYQLFTEPESIDPSLLG